MTGAPTSLIDLEYLDPRSVGPPTKNTFRGFFEIRWLGIRYVQKLLRIAINQREPGALDLHHDAMARAERV